jgi:predicted lipoprotein with Yx(FWY)xxD motif
VRPATSAPPITGKAQSGRWSLYRFSGDAAPGDTHGQGSGGSWFVIAPNGKLIK